MIVCLTLAILFFSDSPWKRPAVAIGFALSLCIGLSRVMLGVHWLSDVIAGLAFGWAWFAICAIAFGGRFLSFGAPLKTATDIAASEGRSGSSPAVQP